MMFNNLGLYSFWMYRRRRPVRPVSRPMARSGFPLLQQIGGAGQDFFINGGTGPAGPPGPPGPPGPAGAPSPVTVTIVNTTPYAALLTDYLLEVDVPATSSITLPVSPLGTVFIVKDISGNASANPITVTATTTIDGAASALINSDYGSITLVFNSTEWNIV